MSKHTCVANVTDMFAIDEKFKYIIIYFQGDFKSKMKNFFTSPDEM